ncbi:MAG: lamin tail domain-containing protein [Patescibacteria group bacterium]|jgi:PKD repeat protein
MRRKAILVFIFLFCLKAQASESDLVVSEIMYDAAGSDSGHEWIELYNSGLENVTVSSTWRFFDSSNHKINFYQGTSTIASQEFFVLVDNGEQFLLDYPDFIGNIFDTVINLSNTSSSLAISFDEGTTQSLIEDYSLLWGAGGNGYSLEKIDLLASITNNWQESSILGGTPGKINSEKQTEEILIEENIIEEPSQNWSKLIINELLPNPLGSDDNEWIELYNSGDESLNLDGLKIKDNATRVFILDVDSGLSLALAAHSYLVIPKSLSGISLNNSNGDGVFIMDPDNNLIDSVVYNDIAIEGRSYARSENYFVWSKTATPGANNQILVNQAPVAQISIAETDFIVGEKISFSASASYDPDGEDLDYLWEFGDDQTSAKESIKHSFDKLGTYTVCLTVTDLEGDDDKTEFVLDIKQDKAVSTAETTASKVENIIVDLAEDDLIISEFMPNPLGSDEGEWIELYNSSDQAIDLYAWQIDDEEGGSKPYQFSTSTIISAKNYLVLNRTETKTTLNNTSDSVRLLSPGGDLWQEVSYTKIPEDKTYAWDYINKEWLIGEPSPGVENIFENTKEIETIYGVAELSELAKNSFVLVQGIAINSTDKDTRSLYLADYNFLSLNFEEVTEVYSYYKNFPDIKAGDLVTVSGQISKLDDLPRLKIKTAQDIWQNDVSIKLSEPEIVDVGNIDEDLLGSYLRIKGIVVKKSGNNIYVASDIEEEHIVRVYSKFSSKDLEIKKGDEIIVAGILSQTDSAFKLVPFGIKDIAVSKQVLGSKINAEPLKVADISTSTEQVVGDDNRKDNIKNILIFLVGGLVLLVLIYIVRKKRNNPIDNI